MLPCAATMLIPELPWRLERLLLGVLIAALAWSALQILSKTVFRRQPWRSLLLSSCLSVCSTVLAIALTTWLLQLIPARAKLSILELESLRGFLLACGAAWTIRRWRGCFRGQRTEFTERLPSSLANREKLFLVDVLEKLLSTTSFVLLLLAALEILGVPVSVLATAGGLGAAAVAFGAQNVVSNSLTGFSLYINRPFVVGDFIEIPSEKLSGFVERISWYYTQLRTYDREPIFIPNSIFGRNSVINVSEIDNRRLVVNFSVTYNDRNKIPAIREELLRQLERNENVDQQHERFVILQSYGESSLDCQLVCCSTGNDYLDALELQHTLLLLVGDVVESLGASMPFPTRTVIQTNTQGEPIPLTPDP